MQIVNKAIRIAVKNETIFTIYEGTIDVKRYRQPNRYRGVYHETVPALIFDSSWLHDFGDGRKRQTHTHFSSPEFDVDRLLWHLLDSWATRRIRDYGYRRVCKADKKRTECVRVRLDTAPVIG